MQATIVIPAHNEGETIGKVVAAIKKLDPGYDISVVDDGSEDDTASVAEKAGARVVRHHCNKGYGAALKTGIRNAKYETIVLFDADEQHDARDIPAFLEKLESCDMVVGDRGKSHKEALHRMPGRWLLSSVANYIVGHKIPDINCGFRCLKKGAAEQFFNILPNGFSFSTTITLAFIKEGYNVVFIPIVPNKRTSGSSRVNIIRDGAKTLLLIVRVITLFDPLKIFAPAAVLLLLTALIYGGYFMITARGIPKGALLTGLSGIIILFFGILSDQISGLRRQLR